MTIRSLTYTDIPETRRRDTVTRMRLRLQERLVDRTLTPEQREDLMVQLQDLDKWAAESSVVEGEASDG